MMSATSYVIEGKVSYDMKKDGINVYHAHCFHGEALNTRLIRKQFGAKEEVEPLMLEKNAYDCRYVFQQIRYLVVPDELKRKLAGFKNLEFQKVVFSKLYFLKYEKGDPSVGPANYSHMNRWRNSFKHEHGLVAEVGDFFEMIVPCFRSVPEHCQPAQEIEFDSISVGARRAKLGLSQAMLDEFPVFWTPEGTVVRGDVMELMQPYFDWTYFLKQPIVLQKPS